MPKSLLSQVLGEGRDSVDRRWLDVFDGLVRTGEMKISMRRALPGLKSHRPKGGTWSRGLVESGIRGARKE